MSGPELGGLEVDQPLPPQKTDTPEAKKTAELLRSFSKKAAAVVAAGALSLVGAIEAKPARAGGGYPWDSARPTGQVYDWWIDQNGNGRFDRGEDIDPYSYNYRNCTSFAAWDEAKWGVSMPRGLGNAKNWDDNAPKYGYGVDTSPRDGDVAVWNAGAYGHVAFVDSVNPDGSVNVSQYNRNGRGEFTQEPNRRADAYIHFMTDAQRANYDAQMGLGGPSSASRVEAVYPVDFNGDGFGDVELTSKRGDPAQNEQVQLGNNWLGAPNLWAAPPGDKIPFAGSLNLAGDVTGDGRADLITITPDADGVHPDIWLQRSLGASFGPPDLVGVPNLIAKDTRWAMGDFNGDHLIDLAAFSRRGDVGTNLTVFPSLGNWLGGGQFWGSTGADIPFDASRFLPGDKTGLGRDGLYAIAKHPDSPNPYVYWLRSTGQNFESPVLTAIPGYKYEDAQFMAGKFDRNNTTDLLMVTPRSDAAPNLQVLASDGGNSYAPPKLWSAPGEIRRKDAIYLPADLNGDGLMDVLAIQPHDAGSVEEWWLKSTGGSFARPQEVGIPIGNMQDYRYGR